MIQELCFAHAYIGSGAASPAYGGRYLNELLERGPARDLAFEAVGLESTTRNGVGLEDPQS